MSLIRPEIVRAFGRWREFIFAKAIMLGGILIAVQGGWLLGPAGIALAVLGFGLSLGALRRMRFSQVVDAPGTVEVLEGEISYFGPRFGGLVSIPELVELRLTTIYGRRHWRLKQDDGQAIVIPVAAAGAEVLYDTFASLPGIDMGRLLSALDERPDTGADAMLDPPLWRRPNARP